MLNRDCRLVSPYFILEELRSDKEKIMHFSKNSIGEFEFTLAVIEGKVKLVSEDEYKEFLSGAIKFSPHFKDNPYFALALSLNCSIWSDEKAFKKQSKVKVFSTKDLLKLLKSR